MTLPPITYIRVLLLLTFAAAALAGLTLATGVSGAAGVGMTPSIRITAQPPSATSSSSATFAWDEKATSSTACSLDGGQLVPCSSPTTYTDVHVGAHTFTAVAYSNNKKGTAQVTTQWEVTATVPPPSLSLTSQPSNPTAATTASFAWTSSNASGFTCSLDAAALSTCASPKSYAGLTAGAHTFVVKATGSGGTSQITSNWNVTTGTAAPTVTITSGPASSTTASTAAFSWNATDATSFSCKLDGGGATACTSPVSYSGLSTGTHTFAVTATGPGGTASDSASWSVTGSTTAAPTVSITSAPPSSTTSTSASFAWSATNATSFTCKLDGGSAAACTSPVSYSGLSAAGHTFVVTATGSGGTASDSSSWTVTSSSPAPTTSVAAPAGPSSYSVPSGAKSVSTSAELASALAATTPTDIVLADGTYDQGTPFTNGYGHHIYAQRVGGATLKAGLVLGGNFGSGGGSVRGVVFDVSSTSKVLGGGIVHVWGPGGVNSRVLDCVFRGNGAIPYGIVTPNPTGLQVQRSQFSNFTDVGLRLSDNRTVSYGSSTPKLDVIQDIVVDTVSRSTPGSSNGTAESGLWIGHPVTNGVHRIKIRNTAWSGVELANNAWNTTFTDIDIDMNGPRSSRSVGVYLEHYSFNNTFDRFRIVARTGFNAEWADPSWGGKAAAHDTVIRNGTVDATGVSGTAKQAGVFLDEGTESTQISGVVFRAQNWAGIGAYKTVGSNSFTGNTFAVADGASDITYTHP